MVNIERSVIKLNISNLMLDYFRLGLLPDSLKHQFVNYVQFICTIAYLHRLESEYYDILFYILDGK